MKHSLESRLVALAEGVDLGAKVGSSGTRLREVATEGRLDEGAEDELRTTGRGMRILVADSQKGDYLPEDGKTKPQKEHELEGEVEGEPVHNVDQTLNDGEECKDNPVLCHVIIESNHAWRMMQQHTVSH